MDAGSDGSASLLSVALPVVEDEVCELLVVVPPEEPDPAELFAEGELPPPPPPQEPRRTTVRPTKKSRLRVSIRKSLFTLQNNEATHSCPICEAQPGEREKIGT